MRSKVFLKVMKKHLDIDERLRRDANEHIREHSHEQVDQEDITDRHVESEQGEGCPAGQLEVICKERKRHAQRYL